MLNITDVLNFFVFIFQSLLDEPNPNSPANSQAAQLYQENKREYEKRVSAIVEQSWRDCWPLWLFTKYEQYPASIVKREKNQSRSRIKINTHHVLKSTPLTQ